MTAAEAKAIIDRFAAADSSMAAIAAVANQLIDQVAADAQALSAADRRELERWRAKTEVNRARTKVRMRALRARDANVCQTSSDANVCQTGPDASRTRARSSSSFLEVSKIDDDGDARARATEKKSAKQAATEIEATVKAAGRWPAVPSTYWNHSAVIAQIDHRIRQGVDPQVMIDASRIAAARATAVIHSFGFFNKPGGPIEQAHAQATDEPQLPLMRSIEGGKGARNGTSSRNGSGGGFVRNAIRLSQRAASQGDRSDGS